MTEQSCCQNCKHLKITGRPGDGFTCPHLSKAMCRPEDKSYTFGEPFERRTQCDEWEARK